MNKRIRLRTLFCLLALLLLSAGSGTVVSAARTKAAGKQLKGAAKKKKNAAEVKALQALIKKQKKKGAAVSSNINDSWEYSWDKNGHLKAIHWEYAELSGKVSFSVFTQLKGYPGKYRITDIIVWKEPVKKAGCQ